MSYPFQSAPPRPGGNFHAAERDVQFLRFQSAAFLMRWPLSPSSRRLSSAGSTPTLSTTRAPRSSSCQLSWRCPSPCARSSVARLAARPPFGVLPSCRVRHRPSHAAQQADQCRQSTGLGHFKAHSSPIVHRHAEDGAAVDAPGLRRLSGLFSGSVGDFQQRRRSLYPR